MHRNNIKILSKFSIISQADIKNLIKKCELFIEYNFNDSKKREKYNDTSPDENAPLSSPKNRLPKKVYDFDE